MRGKGGVDSQDFSTKMPVEHAGLAAGEEGRLILPKFTPVLDVDEPVGWSERRLSVEGEAYLDRDLPMLDLSIFDVAASFDNLEPAKITQAAGRFGECVLDGIFDAIGGGAHKFDFLVDMVAHSAKTNAAPQPTPI